MLCMLWFYVPYENAAHSTNENFTLYCFESGMVLGLKMWEQIEADASIPQQTRLSP